MTPTNRSRRATHGLPKSYLARPDVLALLRRAIESESHVIVFGDPGQGKTTAVRHALAEVDHLLIQCRRKQQIPDLYRSILFEAGAAVTTERRFSKKRTLPASVRLADAGRDTETTEALVTVDLGNVCDVVRVIQRVFPPRWIVLNDFQILSNGAQRTFARDLKYVAENTECRFLIIGAWSGAARFLDLNEDAGAFVSQVWVRPWTQEELREVLRRMEAYLATRFSTEVESVCLDWAAGSLRTLQEITTHVAQLSAQTTNGRRRRASMRDAALATRAIESFFERPFGRYGQLVKSFAELVVMTATHQSLRKWVAEHRGWRYDTVAARNSGVQNAKAKLVRKNQKAHDRAVARRALLEFLASRNWNGDARPCTVTECAKLIGGSETDPGLWARRIEKAMDKLIEMARQADVSPDPVEYDQIDASIRVVDQKFRAFLAKRGLAGIRELFVERRLSLAEDEELGYKLF